MFVRLGAAICGAAIMLVHSSAAMAKSEIASVYANAGEKTVNGERTNPGGLTAAYRTLAFGTRVRLTKTATAIVLVTVLAACMVCAGVDYSYAKSVKAAMQPELDSTTMELQRLQLYAGPTRATVVGTASTYNPHVEGIDAGGMQTASGEPYDPTAWTAAIQTGLREQFGGVRYGKNYQPAYALVEGGKRKIIVKINDVGPLKPGRVIDLNERSMHYFDPSLQLGLLHDMRITLLHGDDWTPGPVGGEQLISFQM